MTHLDIFGQFRPFAIGFDRYFEDLDRLSNLSQPNYPPYNVVKVDDENFIVELAVAGFSKDELSIEVKDRTLMITGEHVSKGRDFIHRGISTKKFKRTFRLSEYVQVNGATLKDGILAIVLKLEIPEEKRPRQINID